MSTSTQVRYRTGQSVEYSAVYRFDGYTDGSYYPSPTSYEFEKPLSKGETCPPIRSSGKACYWLLVRYA